MIESQVQKLENQLKATSLAKSYGKRKIVTDMSLEINSHEVIGLLGPNGAGKTTMFYMIVGLIKADVGNIFIDNKDISKLSMHKRAGLGLGYLPQDSSIFKRLTVYENIMAILELQPSITEQQRETECQKLLNEFNIQHIKDSLGQSLSGGERRRVEIARCLAIFPKFILLDEPFAGVDPISVLDIQNIISYLKKRGIGILITDHNVRETLQVCDRAYILFDGKLLAKGKPEEIMANDDVKNVYLGENFK